MAHIEDEMVSVGDTKETILELLLGGSKSAGEVAETLQIQKSAVRVHLESLQSSGAVRSKFKIDKSKHPNDLEQSLKIINEASDQMGFASSLGRDEKDNSFYIQSKNCILHKVATTNQDMVCHGLHDKIISKSLEGKSDARVELKECMALGNEYCRHLIRSGT